MNNIAKFAIIILALSTIFAMKPYYGGDVALRLNEPSTFAYTPSDYSNLVFYSLIYENLFHIRANGEIFSNIFSRYKYEEAEKTLILDLKKHLSFSNGNPITPDSIKLSLRLFLDMKLDSAGRLGRIIKSIETRENQVLIRLMYDNPDIVGMLAVPELVLLSGTDGIFSGIFYPVEWEKGRFIMLQANKYFPGGRSYLDSLKVVFYDYYYPDVFLSKPGLNHNGFKELNAGIYQNIYLCFPHGKVGNNTRMAVYSLLKEFAEEVEMNPLSVLTSEDESPVTLNIKSFSMNRVRTILRRSRTKLYIASSLRDMEPLLDEFLKKKRIHMETIFISDNELAHFIDNTRVDYLLKVKVFNKRIPIDVKIKKIVKEMSFNRFNETYLKMMNELDEVRFLKNEEMLMESVARLIEKVVGDGFLLPLFQKRYSFYVKERVKGIELDYYGRPLFQRIAVDRPEVDWEAEPGKGVAGSRSGDGASVNGEKAEEIERKGNVVRNF